jgi:N-hydroxyarylamine O-acetyltransferase
MFDVDVYLSRIGYRGALAPSVETLRGLHTAHMAAAPFENLDIHLGRPIVLDEDALFEKIVNRRRGGFCYELNGLFSALLRRLGFRVARLSAGVRREDGSYGPWFDHMTLRVELEDRWLADVGFGDSFREPLKLDEGGDQVRDGRAYRVRRDDREGVMARLDGHGAADNGYRFRMLAYELADYEAMCRYHQTSPESPFTRKRVCSRVTPRGRITLTDGRLILTENGRRTERPLADDAWPAALREWFGIDLDA